jgi:hypothetical protein
MTKCKKRNAKKRHGERERERVFRPVKELRRILCDGTQNRNADLLLLIRSVVYFPTAGPFVTFKASDPLECRVQHLTREGFVTTLFLSLSYLGKR